MHLANFIDEANLYKRDLLQIHHRLEITATGGVDISTNEIAAKIEKYGRTAQVNGIFFIINYLCRIGYATG